jgi:hypothetical protein
MTNTRQETNLEIVRLLEQYFSRPENRDIRFFQALSNMGLLEQQYDDRLNVTGVADPFYQESTKTLQIIKEKI